MRYRFGTFVLDCDARQLRRGDTPVHLSPRAFEFLALLIEARPKALTKAQLLEQLWPGTFVTEGSLANLASEVRTAIEDDAREPMFVRTVQRYGYAFSGSAVAAGDEVTPVRAHPRFRLLWEEREISLSEGENVVGRDPDVTVCIESPGVSRSHARIIVRGDTAIIEDLGSKNGTFVGDCRITVAVPLGDGDAIRVGSALLTFRAIPVAGSTETVPSQSPPGRP